VFKTERGTVLGAGFNPQSTSFVQRVGTTKRFTDFDLQSALVRKQPGGTP
jgi:hypothetical protein